MLVGYDDRPFVPTSSLRLECLTGLYQLGISAQLALLPASRYIFADCQEGLENWRWRLALPDDAANNVRIAAAVDTVFQHDESGGLAVPYQPNAIVLPCWTRTLPE